MQRNKWLALLGLMFVFTACDSNRIYDSYQSLPDAVFNAEQPVEFQFSISDTISQNKVFIQIRNNKDYGYSNLYLITEMKTPVGKLVIDTLQYEMADSTGKFLGAGVSDIKESRLCFTEDCKGMVFENAGDYNISIRQSMRKNGEVEGIKKLQGITDVGFRIEKAE